MSTKMNKFTIRMIISIAIIIIATLFPNVSLGWNLGLGSQITVGMDITTWTDGIKYNQYTLTNRDGLYCIQRDASIKSSRTNTFKVVDKISIEGTQAARTSNYGTTQSNNSYNAKMSYILSGGSWTKQYGTFHKTYYPRQVAIYKYWNTWVNNSGLGLSGYAYNQNNDSGIATSESSKIISAADAYAKGNNAEYKPVQLKMITSTVSVTGTTIGQRIGPFKANYTGNAAVIAYDASGNAINKIELYNANGSKINTVPNGANFYVKNNSNSEIAKVDIKVTSKVLKTDIYILKCISGQQVQRIMAVNSSSSTQSVSANIKVNVTPTGNLTVIKKDKETSANLKGMEFKIRTSKGWLQATGTRTYKYDASFNSATTFKLTLESGNIIKNLLTGVKYQVWETKTPDGEYILSEQDNYDSNYKAVNLTGEGKWITLTQNKTQTVTYDNRPMIKATITGYVWIDQKQKNDENNSLYNEGEAKLAGVTVNLKQKSNNTTVATTITDANGNYTFKEIVRPIELNKYYVEFDYSTTSDGIYNQYIPVAYNSANINQIVANGSRALADAISYKDEELRGIASTYKGTDQEGTYGLSGILYDKLYDSKTYTLSNINLGIKPIYDPDYTLAEYLDYVKINMNGYEYTYKYGEKAAIESSAVPTVNFGDKTDVKLYTRAFYPSDVTYNKKNPGSLQVFVVYGITIKNTTNYSKEYEYMEKELCVTELTNTFDSDRYTLEATGEYANWKGDSASGKAIYTGDTIVIPRNEAVTKYIQFKVNDNAISEILNDSQTIENLDLPTTASSKAYHIYTRKDYSWKNNIEAEQEHTTKSEDRISKAPYLLFQLGDSRRIQGTVFEDTVVTTDGQKLGNGIYDSSNEKGVDGVLVELLNENKNIAQVYPLPQDGKLESIGVNGTVVTSNDGKFTISDIVPGKYYLRFTYPNGATKLYNANGEEITLDKYKSTIVTSKVAKEALKKGVNAQWYKQLEGINYSIAVDDLELRRKYNSGDNTVVNMKADTALLDITIENTDEEIMEDANNVHYSLFEGFNFGIITQPRQSVDVEKLITNVKLVNEPNIIFNGNPELDTMAGVTDLDGKDNNGSTYTRAEIVEESLYGSTLTITYEIKVTNTSDLIYYETDEAHLGWYYMFGENGNYSKEVQLSVDNVADYLDPKLIYSASSMNVVEAQGANGEKYLSITELGVLSRKETKKVTLEAYKVLSMQEGDMNFKNDATVLELTNIRQSEDINNETANKSLLLVIKPQLPGLSETEVVVTPPTGSDRLEIIMYVITGVVMLGILSAGIVIIKKKVL